MGELCFLLEGCGVGHFSLWRLVTPPLFLPFVCATAATAASSVRFFVMLRKLFQRRTLELSW